MTMRSRSVRFDAHLLDEIEQRWCGTQEDFDRFVNGAVDREARRREAEEHRPAAEGPQLDAIASAYCAALMEHEPRRARTIVDDALAAGVPVIDVYARIFKPALEDVGHRWVLDRINVADEHYATTVTQQILGALSAQADVEPLGGRLAVVTASPDEQHALGVQMVSDVLARDRWEVLSLGAATPVGDLLELVRAECPDVVALSTATAGRVPRLQEAIERLAAVTPRPFIAVGGPVCESTAMCDFVRSLGADLVSCDLWELLAVLRRRFPPADLPKAASS